MDQLLRLRHPLLRRGVRARGRRPRGPGPRDVPGRAPHRRPPRARGRALDLDRRVVEAWDDEAGQTVEVGFDTLHIATGAAPCGPTYRAWTSRWSTPHRPSTTGWRCIHGESGRGRVVVVGGGYIGLEMAEAFVQQGARGHAGGGVRPPDAHPRRRRGRRWWGAGRAGRDVRLRRRSRPSRMARRGGRRAIPPTSWWWASASGPARSSPGRRASPSASRVPSGSTAPADQRRGRVGGGRLLRVVPRGARRRSTSPSGRWPTSRAGWPASTWVAATRPFPGVLGTAVTKVCNIEIGRTGLSEAEADQHGFAYVEATVEGESRAGYFPERKKLTLKALAERGSRRLLGAQIVGAGARQAHRRAGHRHPGRHDRRRRGRARPRLRPPVRPGVGPGPPGGPNGCWLRTATVHGKETARHLTRNSALTPFASLDRQRKEWGWS